MREPAYKIKSAITAVVVGASRERLECLNSGCVLVPISEANSAGMIHAICEGRVVRVFARDVDERCEAVKAASPA